MRYRLRDELYYCFPGGRAVFLDVTANRYFALPRSAENAFSRLVEGTSLSPEHHASLMVLVEDGKLIPDPLVESFSQPVEVARQVVQDGPQPRGEASVYNCLSAAYTEISSQIILRRQSLAEILHSLRAKRERAGSTNDGEAASMLADISVAFDRTALIFRPADRCLVRSLAFMRMCFRRGIFPTMVFGVRAHPFVAHCWVQYGDRIVHDDVGQAPLFTPILSV